MKKILFTIICLVLVLASLSSCASIDSYIENLENHGDFEVTKIRRDDEIDEIAAMVHLDPKDYGVKEIVYGHSGNSGVAIGVVIVECGSKSKAKNLEKEVDEIVEYMKSLYPSNMYPISYEREGKFLIVGSDMAIDAAK